MGIFGGWLIGVVFIGVDNGGLLGQMRALSIWHDAQRDRQELRLRWAVALIAVSRLRLRAHRRRRVPAITRTVVSSAPAIPAPSIL